jgi:streptogramin lyase
MTRKLISLLPVALACALVLGALAGAAPLGDVTEFALGSAGAFPAAITAGADENVWFSDRGTPPGAPPAVWRASTAGTLATFPLRTGASPRVIAQGPDGNLWFADGGTQPAIGRIAPDGTITEFDLAAGSSPDGVVAGPDGNVWFMDRSPTAPAVGRITTAGELLPTFTLEAGSMPHAMAVGPDGNFWFADAGSPPSAANPTGTAGAIGKVTPAGVVTKLRTGLNPGSQPDAIVRGPDGNLWFTDIGTTKAVGKVTPDGTITEFTQAAGLRPGGSPRGITAGPDGNVWFTDQAAPGQIGRITPAGQITEVGTGLNTGSIPFRIATGPDGNLWFSDSGPTRAVGRFGVGAPAALVSAPSIGGGGDQGRAQTCGGVVWSSWADTQPSSSAFPFDGTQWLRDGSPIAGATGETYTPVEADVGHQLSCRLTVTYTLFNVTEHATSPAVTVKGAAAQLADLAEDVEGVGRGHGLEATVAVARLLVAHGKPGAACVALVAFEIEVRAQQLARFIPKAQADALVADARRIRAVLGC